VCFTRDRGVLPQEHLSGLWQPGRRGCFTRDNQVFLWGGVLGALSWITWSGRGDLDGWAGDVSRATEGRPWGGAPAGAPGYRRMGVGVGVFHARQSGQAGGCSRGST